MCVREHDAIGSHAVAVADADGIEDLEPEERREGGVRRQRERVRQEGARSLAEALGQAEHALRIRIVRRGISVQRKARRVAEVSERDSLLGAGGSAAAVVAAVERWGDSCVRLYNRNVDRARALAPELPETHLALGYYRSYGNRDFTGALAEFQQAEQGLPNNVDIVYAIGLMQRRLGHWDEATAAMRRAVELDPRNIDAYTNLVANYLVVRRFPDALGVINNLLAFDPTNTNALWFKAYALCAMGNLDALDSVITNPGANAAIRGDVALKRRRYTEAAEILTKGLNEKSIEDKKALLLMLGLAQQHAGNVAAARAAYQELARECQRELEKIAPDSLPATDLHAGLGHAYAGLGDAASAIREGQKSIAIDPTSSDPFEGPIQEESMAEIYAMLGDADHAIPILQRLIKIPSFTAITPALLRISTIWDPIRNDPRFQELVAEKKP